MPDESSAHQQSYCGAIVVIVLEQTNLRHECGCCSILMAWGVAQEGRKMLRSLLAKSHGGRSSHRSPSLDGSTQHFLVVCISLAVGFGCGACTEKISGECLRLLFRNA